MWNKHKQELSHYIVQLNRFTAATQKQLLQQQSLYISSFREIKMY